MLTQALTNPKTGRLEDIGQVAEDAGATLDTVYKWMRRPSEKSNPNSTGRKNPIDYFLRLLRAVYTASPKGARLILKYVLAEFAKLEAKHGREGLMVVWPKEKNGESEADQKRRDQAANADQAEARGQNRAARRAAR